MIFVVVASIAVFALAQMRSLVMMVLARAAPLRTKPTEALPAEQLPTVEVQLPVYRDHVALDRILGAVLALDYPKGKLTVQVLDDSEPEHAALTDAVVERHRDSGHTIATIRRSSRRGFKAGALNQGMKSTSAELLAIFDADFVPHPSFLKQLVPFFGDDSVAAAQGRWAYENVLASSLTAFQAAVFDAVFCFEEDVRQRLDVSGVFMGTAGMWRRQAIEAIGGWQEHPFTGEDLDLSFRAVNHGWKVRYLHECVASCEAIEGYLAYKSQQRRWGRGVFQTLRDNVRGLAKGRPHLRAVALDLSLVLLHASMPAMIVAIVASSVYPYVTSQRSALWVCSELLLSILVVFMPTAAQLLASQPLLHAGWKARVRLLRGAFPASCGLAIAFLEGFWEMLIQKEREFTRTPKGGGSGVLRGSHQAWLRSGDVGTFGEALVAACGVLGIIAGFRGYPEVLIPSAFAAYGFASSVAWTLSERVSLLRRARAQ